MSADGEAAVRGRGRLRPAWRRARTVARWALALACGACATYWPTLHGRSVSDASATYRCAEAAARELGFAVSVGNESDGSLEARRLDRRASALLSMEQRQIDILVTDARRADAAGSSLRVRPETIVQRYTRAGWVDEGRPASPVALRAARELLARCAPEVTPARSR